MIKLKITSCEKPRATDDRFLKGTWEIENLYDLQNFVMDLAENFNPAIDETHLIEKDDYTSLMGYLVHPRWQKVLTIEWVDIIYEPEPEDDSDTSLSRLHMGIIAKGIKDEIDYIRPQGFIKNSSEELWNCLDAIFRNRIFIWKKYMMPDDEENWTTTIDETEQIDEFIQNYLFELNNPKGL